MFSVLYFDETRFRICVPLSDAIDGNLGNGAEKILGMGNVPVIFVFTKFEVVVSRVLFDTAGGDAKHCERARARAYTMYEDSCRRLFHKDPSGVPAQIVQQFKFLAYSFIFVKGYFTSLIAFRQFNISGSH